MIAYQVNGHSYRLSYAELREAHVRLCSLPDEEFLAALPEVLHLACMIAWLKEVPADLLLCDEGLLHQLTHLLHIPDEPLINLQQVRAAYALQLELAP
ncbi:hypothetical protein N7414_15940 [Pseudomonas sp. GD04087]|uniref:hypothetical protein n=1 Tax=unclassified Pseudomonas TaxID=196821 RepID=UPI00244B859E|nr:MULTISPECIES: hypothetical protein [unclassified Pseudomonas]MDH0290616.1 hypothetical protein [Pseudomonas sp. GD04087]MDH1051533.1 hypothetical protein [Pseudomonas sp. GD03903]MDH2002740.1 hypothetical protein [Pseudomonas sp. GD03691]